MGGRGERHRIIYEKAKAGKIKAVCSEIAWFVKSSFKDVWSNFQEMLERIGAIIEQDVT